MPLGTGAGSAGDGNTGRTIASGKVGRSIMFVKCISQRTGSVFHAKGLVSTYFAMSIWPAEVGDASHAPPGAASAPS